VDDHGIVQMYWDRDENAIVQTDKKYGNYCYSIAWQILEDREDADESVNDTYLGAWNSLPPHRPENLAAYLGKLTRRISLKRWRDARASKRGGGQTALALDELTECIPAAAQTERTLEQKELVRAVERFLHGLPQTEQQVFICRYWYLDSIAQISRRFHFSESKVKSMLHRTRERLKVRLIREGLIDECR